MGRQRVSYLCPYCRTLFPLSARKRAAPILHVLELPSLWLVPFSSGPRGSLLKRDIKQRRDAQNGDPSPRLLFFLMARGLCLRRPLIFPLSLLLALLAKTRKVSSCTTRYSQKRRDGKAKKVFFLVWSSLSSTNRDGERKVLTPLYEITIRRRQE